jgi:hypothetical protein
MTEIVFLSPQSSPLWGEGKGEGHFGFSEIW